MVDLILAGLTSATTERQISRRDFPSISPLKSRSIYMRTHLIELPLRHSRHLWTAVDDRAAGLTRATTPNPPVAYVACRLQGLRRARFWFNGGVEDGNRCRCDQKQGM